MNWYGLSAKEVFELLETGENGLSTRDAREKLLRYGPNEIKEGRNKHAINILLGQFKDFMIIILIVAAVMAGIMGDVKDTIAILAIVILNALVGFLQESRAEKGIRALRQMAVAQARVLRDGVSTWEPASVLVPGDIVILEAGNTVPADLRIITSVNLKTEEAALTGESQAIDKVAHSLEKDQLAVGDRKNMAFKGTYVIHGRGTAVVIATGMQTELGRIAQMVQGQRAASPLQQHMTAFGKKLSLLVLGLCGIFFISGWLRGEQVLKMAMTSISLAIAAIPEALPAVITISLALAAKRMTRSNALVKDLPSVETLGAVTVICTDKTGTLTKNQMQVETVFANERLYEREELGQLGENGQGRMLLSAFALNNDVTADAAQNLRGDSTEVALVDMALVHHIDTGNWPRVSEIAFDADRKLMTTFHRHNGKIISFTKGAPDMLLQRCPGVDIRSVEKRINAMAADGHRVLGFAYRCWDELPVDPQSSVHEKELHFLGLASIADSLREEVYSAVMQCKSAGIIPVMITGDHPLTAKNIATRTGILENDQDLLVTGSDLAQMDENTLLAKVEKIKVYARVSPEQKLRIVTALQQKGHYVAMTGDGVNDAPALKQANIGIAMGVSGTDVARDTANMILLDDNFSTIVQAVKEGRRVYDNVLKFITYLMTTNAGELWALMLGPLFGLPVALLPIHILWINLVSDGLPAISLSFEKAEKDIMNRPPRPRQESVFANGRGLHMAWAGMLMAGIVLSIQYWAIRNQLHWQTIVFNLLCLSQMAHLLAIRSNAPGLFKKGFFKNKPLILAVIAIVLIQVVITYTPFFQVVFKTEALRAGEFLLVGAASSLTFFAVAFGKLFRHSSARKAGHNKS
ncbi:ATPase [Chitinophaga parva]|uniref:ATPase n=1 Tax=Chitinophaga parva TaxID=2169414 RepID=A0A2T7BE33_9BACT|nr:cation-translocating P-type ATPase [Chitinophaga parva]PUZ23335.1 ATPase [Chitinophaga parva]